MSDEQIQDLINEFKCRKEIEDQFVNGVDDICHERVRAKAAIIVNGILSNEHIKFAIKKGLKNDY